MVEAFKFGCFLHFFYRSFQAGFGALAPEYGQVKNLFVDKFACFFKIGAKNLFNVR